jgi:hypothetical protein
VLTIDSSTALPLMYEYDPDDGYFRSMGYVRVGSMMATQVDHRGPDTLAARDEFLLKVLISVAVPERQARKIVKDAQHLQGGSS